MSGFRRFLVRRLLTFIPTIIGVTLLVFVIAYAIPADPAKAWIGGGEKVKPEYVEKIREQYHMNDPWYEQYVFLIHGLVTNTLLDPRTSNFVMTEVLTRFPITFQLTLFAFFFAVIIGLPLGILAALKKDSWIDTFVRFFALTGVSLPVFWLGYLLIYLFYVKVRIINLAGLPPSPPKITGVPVIDAILTGNFDIFLQHVHRFWLPGFVLGFMSAGVLARFVRNSFLEALSSDFVEYLKAKGAPKRSVYRHALKNALVPIVTVMGLQFGGLLGGAPITETVFSIPGMGYYAVNSIRNLDFPAVIAVTFIFALTYVTINLIVDILYAFIDPRVRY